MKKLLLIALISMTALAEETINTNIISEATGGLLKSPHGEFFSKDCNEKLDYDAEIMDLNKDGQPEVLTQIQGTCLGGVTGVNVNLYIKDKKSGLWNPQFGFPGIYSVLKTMNNGYPDIEFGGPGFCSPVWRWNGQKYQIYKKCPEH
ncbi:MAG: hypothetical protein ACXW00_07635 [Methylobacter sp.]